MATNTEGMKASEGVKLRKAEQDLANGKLLSEVLAELKAQNEAEAKRESDLRNNADNPNKVGAAEGIRLLKERLAAEKKAREDLEDIKTTTKETLDEVKGSGKGSKSKDEKISLEQQLETTRELAKQSNLLKKIEENTRAGRGAARVTDDKDGFDWGKLLTGLKVVGALAALGTAAWGLVEIFNKAKGFLDGIFGDGSNSKSINGSDAKDIANTALNAGIGYKGYRANRKATATERTTAIGANKMVTDAQADLDAAKKVEAKLAKKYSKLSPESPERGPIEKQMRNAARTSASAEAGVEYAKGMAIETTPGMGGRIGAGARAFANGGPGKFFGPLAFGMTALSTYADTKSVKESAIQGTAAVSGLSLGMRTGAGVATTLLKVGATGGSLLAGVMSAPAIASIVLSVVGGHIGMVLAQHWAGEWSDDKPFTLPPLEAFKVDLAAYGPANLKKELNRIAVALGFDAPFDSGDIAEDEKKSANVERGLSKNIPIDWKDGIAIKNPDGSWSHKTKSKSTGQSSRVPITDSREIEKLEQLSTNNTIAASKIDSSASTAKPINDWTDTLSAGSGPAISIAGLGTAAPIDKELAKAKDDVNAAEAKLATAQAVASEESEEEKKVSAAVTAPEGEGVFGTIVSVLKSIGVGIESMVALMSGGAAAAGSAIVSGGGATGNAAIAMKFFKEKGWSDTEAAAIVGNLQQESYGRLDPAARGDSGKAYGIAQWHPDRQLKFKEVMGKNIEGSSLQDQLAFVQWELTNKGSDRKSAGDKLKGMGDITTATHNVALGYEGTRTDYDKRVNNAKNLVGVGNADSVTSGGSAPIASGANEKLNWAKGVDQDVKPEVLAKLRAVQAATGINFQITSGYRDVERNKAAGGAANSQHLYGNAVDTIFNGGKDAAIRAIRAATAAGFGGIGVFNDGRGLHFDIGSRRCWGYPSIPAWAKEACVDHMKGIKKGATKADGSVIDNVANAVTDPNSRTNAGAATVGSLGKQGIGALGAGFDSLFGTSGGADAAAAVGEAVGKIFGGGMGMPIDIMTSIMKDIPLKRIPLEGGPYSTGTMVPTYINSGRGKFGKSITDAMGLIGASNRNADLASNKASKPITISNPFLDNSTTTGPDTVSVPYPTRNTDPTLMKYLDMLMGVTK